MFMGCLLSRLVSFLMLVLKVCWKMVLFVCVMVLVGVRGVLVLDEFVMGVKGVMGFVVRWSVVWVLWMVMGFLLVRWERSCGFICWLMVVRLKVWVNLLSCWLVLLSMVSRVFELRLKMWLVWVESERILC